MSRSLQSTPKLTDIVSFKTSSGERIQILDQIGTHYSNFGILLLNDKNGAVVKYIALEHSGKAVAINRDILERWLAGKGKQPVTWATLIDVLEDVQLNVLAETIKKNLTIPGEHQAAAKDRSIDTSGEQASKVAAKDRSATAVKTSAKIPEPTSRDLMILVKTDQPIRLGLQLGVEDSDLHIVKRNHPTDHGQQLEDVLSLYMKQRVNPSWEEVATALWNIGENKTAQKIADKYGFGLQLSDSQQEHHQAGSTEIMIHDPKPLFQTDDHVPMDYTDGAGGAPKDVTDGPGFHLHSDEYRGIAILVTCDYVQSPKFDPLPGTNEDFKRMKETFDELKYEVHPIQNGNVTQEKVERLLKGLKEYLEDYEGKPQRNKDGSKKAIAFAFSGHGNRVEGKDDSSVLCTRDGEISLKKDVMTSLCVEGVKDIPKLYFIDACRGDRDLSKFKGGKKPLTLTIESQEGNYRLDFATIPGFVSIDGRWMQVLARKLRKESMESLQHVVANVNKEVHEKNEEFRPKHQLICESRDRLFTGPLYLHPAKYAS